jgi:hypothetical protein
MEKKKGIKVQQIGNCLVINGKYFYPKHINETTKKAIIEFEQINKSKFNKLLVQLAEELAPKVNVKDLLISSLSTQGIDVLEAAQKKLERKTKKTRVTQHRGCTALNVGGVELQIGI